MTVSSTAESRPALTVLTMPPWLWVWVAGYLLAGMPAAISGMYSGVVPFLGHLSSPLQVTDPSLTVESFSSIFGVLIYAPLAAGAVTVLFPHLRGRWVEWRFELTCDDRRIMTEMQQFVKDHDPSIQLRVSIRGDQMARIYPVGWRSARIAVFLPLTTLWKSDRKAAEAILLHEVAHRRQGDQLIMGLGSPFVWLIRIWAPAYLLFVFIPVMVYFVAGGDTFASFVAVSGGQDAVAIPAEIALPVTALWLAELSADQLAAQEIGADALRRALRAGTGPCASPATRAVTLLSHPPRRLRLRRVAARPAGTVALMAVWPAGLVAWLLILPGAMGALTVLGLGSPRPTSRAFRPVRRTSASWHHPCTPCWSRTGPSSSRPLSSCLPGRPWRLPGSGCGLPGRPPAVTSLGGPTWPRLVCLSACCCCPWPRSPGPAHRRSSRPACRRGRRAPAHRSPAGCSAEA